MDSLCCAPESDTIWCGETVLTGDSFGTYKYQMEPGGDQEITDAMASLIAMDLHFDTCYAPPYVTGKTSASESIYHHWLYYPCCDINYLSFWECFAMKNRRIRFAGGEEVCEYK